MSAYQHTVAVHFDDSMDDTSNKHLANVVALTVPLMLM